MQVGQLGQNRILFGGAFQSPQRVGRPSDEPPAEDSLDELSPPAWREDEVSVECHAARVRVDRRDLNLFVLRGAKGQPDIERELPRRTHVEHVECDAEHAGSKDEMIARVIGHARPSISLVFVHCASLRGSVSRCQMRSAGARTTSVGQTSIRP